MNTPQFSESEYRRLLAANARTAAQYKGRCRAASERLGLPVPAWATAPSPSVVARCPAAAPATPAERAFTERSTALFDEHAALRAPGRVLALSVDGGVRLIEWHDGKRVCADFATTTDALAAVVSNAIAWRVAPRKANPKQQPSAKAIP